jgi:integrase
MGGTGRRIRFATGHSFIASYCNARKKKNGKELVKRNTRFYFEYNNRLSQIKNDLIGIAMESEKAGTFSLEQVRDNFYKQIGRMQDDSVLTFDDAYSQFIAARQSRWTDGTRKHFSTIYNHLKEFEETTNEKLNMDRFSETLWDDIRDNYFVAVKRLSNNSTNANLKKLKQFLFFASKKQLLKNKIDFDELKYLDEVDPFKIALKNHEVDALLNFDLSSSPSLDRVRDLFLLEIFCGQRYSDIDKVLDKNHISDKGIQIYQKKTNERVTIPLHDDLKKHIKHIFEKYPQGLPAISNQNFNDYLKELCKLLQFNREHSWVTLVGKKQIQQRDFRYNLVSSHTGRRTFCVLWLKKAKNPEWIMQVCGWRSYDQFKAYVKVDDEDITEAFKGNMISKSKSKKTIISE